MKRKNTFVVHRKKRRKRGNMTYIDTHDKRREKEGGWNVSIYFNLSSTGSHRMISIRKKDLYL